ncbi:type IV secretory system conjugative DNA transfer family protein [Erysipelothrix sp. HDW6A]|uniref:type IV secretory system conjugative DNA transfer family protein n=1 Tax=Erysipelothrix sp. HDW6A TaxID=2714928 RepID=UPI00140B3796|nr:type IV secretory system conjugative DNA transfer family protein [Erysipelothrix sp. HDW6A]QIK58220.1 type IV secretory system conjugative DNA transfer family protein [Erysipelothrix sp. HDW6A]
MKLLKWILEWLIMAVILFFVMLNILNWFEVVLPAVEASASSIKYYTFDTRLMFESQYKSYLVVYCLVVGVAFVMSLFNKIDYKRKIGFKTSYDKKSYARLLTNRERRRGTKLVRYQPYTLTRLIDAPKYVETLDIIKQKLLNLLGLGRLLEKTAEDLSESREIVINQGDVTEEGFWKAWLRFKTLFSKHYNKVAHHFLLPATKIWNEVKTDKDGNEIVIGGLPVMAMRQYFLYGKFDKVFFIDGDLHTLFVGSTGRGKTYTYVLPMMYSYIAAGENIVVHDPKREIDAFTRKKLEENGYKVIVIDFVDPLQSDGWNPLEVPYKAWKKAIDDEFAKDIWKYDEETETYTSIQHIPARLSSDYQVQEKHIEQVVISKENKYKEGYKYANVSDATELTMAVAQALTWEEDAKDPFWHEGAGDMFAGGALFAMEESIDEYVNAKTARYLIELGDDADEAGIPLLKKYLKKYRDIDSESTRKLATYLNADGNTKPSLKSVFMNKVSLLTANDNIMNMTSTSTFDMEQIFREKTCVFLKTHDERSTYYPLVTIFFKQLYEVGIKVTRERPAEQKLEIPMNWIIDEFGLLPEIKDIEAIYGAARSRSFRINAFIQTFEQLQDKYEPNVAAIIEDNSSNVIYLGSQSVSTRKRFSELAGNELVYDKRKKEYISRPVITPERLRSFEKGRSLINTIEWNPFIAKLPPYTGYSFAKKAAWEFKPEIPKTSEYFNIQVEWVRRNNEAKTKRKKQHQSSGARETNWSSTEGKAKTVSMSKEI